MIALASIANVPPQFQDDAKLIAALARRGVPAEQVPWQAEVDWSRYELVFVRSTWNYTQHHAEFLSWIRSLPVPTENAPEVLRWNSDKRYLADLVELGVPCVPTRFVDSGQPELAGEVVVKPTVSAGARDTGRFTDHDQARALIERIIASGRTAMLQPYLASLAHTGETAAVYLDGRFSHALHKKEVLRPDEVAPLRGPDEPAEAMFDPELVTPSQLAADERELADRVVSAVRQRFDLTPLVLRIDMVRADSGQPILMELEAIEPHLYFDQAPGAVDRVADAVLNRR